MTESGTKDIETTPDAGNDFSNGHIENKDGDKEDGTSDITSSSWRRCCFVSMFPFSLYFGFVSLVTSALGAYLTSQITTIEKQFGLSSTESGLLLSMNDAGYLITVLFISYFGRNSHIPRILGVCSFTFGVSALICIIPHLFTDNSLLLSSMNVSTNTTSNTENLLCSVGLNHVPPETECSDTEDSFQSAAKTAVMAFIASGMFVQGIAKSPRVPLMNTYVDDNVPKSKSGFYIGIVVALSIFGPAVSYGIGGAISRIYITLEETDMTPRDPRWVGAWWLGFLVFGILAILLSFPVCLFPKALTHTQPDNEAHSAENPTKEAVSLKSLVSAIKGIFPALKRLATNPVYVPFVIGSALRVFSIAGFIAFTPKYMQIHYGLSIFKSNIIVGFLGVGSAAIAVFFSGIITRTLRLELKGMLKFLIIVQIISSGISLVGMFLVCPQPEIQDFYVNSDTRSLATVSAENMTSCSAGCNCDNSNFFPVCGSNGVTYFSPCHAGCQEHTDRGYTDCLCISNVTNDGVSPHIDATPGMCHSECSLYIVFSVIQFLSSFISGLAVIPATLISLRSVESRDKSLAVGVTSFCTSLFGWFLAPVIMGFVIDTTCRLWNMSCSREGSCAVYDIVDFRLKFHAVDAGLGLGYIVCFIISYMFLVRGGKGKPYVTERNEGEKELEGRN